VNVEFRPLQGTPAGFGPHLTGRPPSIRGMARPLRIQFPGALYHVTSRGNERAPIFFTDRDRRDYLTILGDVVEKYGWLCPAYCLMPNHYHLVVQTPEPNLSRGMHQLNGVYTQRLNRRHDRVGHLFQGRFKAILVERESHLLEVARYVVLNPVRAAMVRHPEEYRWSSLRATLGLERAPRWLRSRLLVGHFGSRRRYREFVLEGIGQRAPWAGSRGSVLGSDDFAQSVGRHVEHRVGDTEFPRVERVALHEPLDRLFPSRLLGNRALRDRRIREVSRRCPYSLTDIARHLGLHRSTISKIAGTSH
jgi:putative transposase